MAAASAAISSLAPPQSESLPSFSDWLRSKAAVVTLPVAIAITSFLFNVFNSHQHFPLWFSEHAETVPHCLHALLILVLLFVVPHGFETSNPNYARSVAATERFRTAWRLTLLAWFALYGSLIIDTLKVIPSDADLSFQVLEDFLSCLSTVGFWFCFITVSNPDKKNDPVQWVGILVCVVGLDVVGLLTKFSSLMFLSQVAISSLSGIAMAFFVGRLESRLLRPPRWLLGVLYGYAVLQFGYAFLYTQSSIRKSVYFLIALVFKILLALFVNWLIGTGNLLFYLHYMSELNHDYEGKRRSFFQQTDSSTQTISPS